MNGSDAVLLLGILTLCTPIILAIVQGLKQTGMTSTRYALIASLITGILIAALIAATNIIDGFDLRDDPALTILAGIMSGLGASGLYSGGRAVLTGVSASNPQGRPNG